MTRPLWVAVALVLAAPPVLAQPHDDSDRLANRPAALLASETPAPTDLALSASASDSLSDAQTAHRIANLYARQADLLRAEASGDLDLYEDLLDGLVMDLEALARRPGIQSVPRFQEVYRSVLVEFEQYYDEPALDRGDIYAIRAEVFAASEAPEGTLLENVTLPDVGYAETLVAMDMNPRVAASLTRLQRLNSHVARVRARMATYFPMIERVLREEGVPDEMKYLAIVESALNPTARSHAGAVGLWQFMRATGRSYGLDVTSYVDERRDPELATRAAARHLRDLADMFGGNYHLAMAAYNCGAGCVRSRIRRWQRRTGSDEMPDYWQIYDSLPRETRGYVPMFIASAVLFSNPEAFGLDYAEPGPRYAFDAVPVRGGTTFRDIAQAAGVSTDVIEALNPMYRRGVVPEGPSQLIRVPLGQYAQHQTRLDRLGGRTMLAARSVTYPGAPMLRPIAAVEPTPTVRRPTQPVRPAVAAAPPRPRPAAPEPAERASVADVIAQTPPPVRTASVEEPAAPAEVTVHRVQRGEHLTRIARQYGVTVQNLVDWNNLSSTTLAVGQRITVRQPATAASAPAEPARPASLTHTVRRGEHLTMIARRYGVTVREIVDWNRLRSTTLAVGQRLTIRPRRGAIG